MPPSPKPHTASVQSAAFPGQFDSLSAILQFVTQAAKRAGLDAQAIYAVQLAVDEACSNIIEHAYGGEGQGEIQCVCVVNRRGLTVTLRDQGAPFDPSSVPDPDLYSPLEERREGGLGLYLMRRLMDELHFEFIPGTGNVLTMVKRRRAPAKPKR